MAIAYVSHAAAVASSVSLSSFSAGNLAIVLAHNGTNTTVPSLPAGWTNISSKQGGSFASRIGYRILQGGDTSTGTWTNATNVGVIIFSGVHQGAPIQYPSDGLISGAYNIRTATTNVSWPGFATVIAESRNVVIAISGSGSDSLDAIAATGWTNLTSASSEVYFGAMMANADGTTTSGNYTAAAAASGATIVLGLLPDNYAYPMISAPDTTSGVQASNSSSWTVTWPTNIAAGDFILVMLSIDGAASTWSGGGTTDRVNIGSAASGLQMRILTAAGTETGTFTATISGSEQGCWMAARIPASLWGAEIVNTAGNSGSSTSPNPGNLDALVSRNWLWFACAGNDGTVTYNNKDANFAYMPGSPQSSGGAGGAAMAWAYRPFTAQALDPGTFTLSGSDDWAAFTAAVRPAEVVARVPKFSPYPQIIPQ